MAHRHTPAPWLISWETLKGSEHNVIYKNKKVDLIGIKIAFVNTLYTIGNNDRDKKEGIANAKLIAAAPELLEALEMVINDLPFNPSETTYKAIEAAIKKATE